MYRLTVHRFGRMYGQIKGFKDSQYPPQVILFKIFFIDYLNVKFHVEFNSDINFLRFQIVNALLELIKKRNDSCLHKKINRSVYDKRDVS